MIAFRTRAGDPAARDRYLKFLSAGGSKYPIDLLKDAKEVTVKLTDRREFKAKVLGADAKRYRPDPAADRKAVRTAGIVAIGTLMPSTSSDVVTPEVEP